MSQPDPTEADRVSALLNELTDARRRGLGGLDRDSGQKYQPVPVPELEALARTYSNDAASSRAALIRDLLIDALDEWEKRKYKQEARFVRRLFFTADGQPPGRGSSPRTLKDAVKEEWKLDDDHFDEQRRAIFRQFARFLIKFASSEPAATESATDPELTTVDDEPQTQASDREEQPVPPVQASDDGLRPVSPQAPRNRPLWLIPLIALLVAAGVFLAFVLSTRSADRPTEEPGSAVSSSSAAPTARVIFLTFDALGGGSPIIRVFPGVTDALEHQVHNGTFRDGDRVRAICKKTGRLVASDISLGERNRRSDVWIQIDGTPGVVQFARLTYATMSTANLEALPRCPG